jgi:hypothetical protein
MPKSSVYLLILLCVIFADLVHAEVDSNATSDNSQEQNFLQNAQSLRSSSIDLIVNGRRRRSGRI